MNKIQIAATVFSLALVIFLFQLPRVVIQNDEKSEFSQSHTQTIRVEDQVKINSLKALITTVVDFEKNANFADSLSELYLNYQMTDSATRVADWIQNMDSSSFFQVKAALIYFRAFQLGGEESREWAGKSASIFEKELKRDTTNLTLKNKLAMSLTASDSPMKGIMMLREILASDPENREAIFNLGLLAIRSGQYDKAEERFLNLIELSSEDHEAYFYLGVVQKELGKTKESIDAFEKYTQFENSDRALKATAEEILKELNNI